MAIIGEWCSKDESQFKFYTKHDILSYILSKITIVLCLEMQTVGLVKYLKVDYFVHLDA